MQRILQAGLLKEEHKFKATILAYILTPLSGLATDIYLPSMPHMAVSLGASEQQVQLTLALFLISYGLFQWIGGTLIDTFGRYRIAMTALAVFCISCIITATTDSIWVVLAMRVVQGISVACNIVAKRALFVDLYEGEERRKYLSVITMVWGVAPIVAPYIGGYLESIFNWRANFYFLAAFSAVCWILEWKYSGETIKKRSAAHLGTVFKTYAAMLSNPAFTGGLFMLGISYGLVMLYGLSGSFILQHRMGYSAIVAGNASLFLGSAWMGGGFLSRLLINRPLTHKAWWAVAIQFGVAAGMTFTAYKVSNLYSLLIFAYLIHLAAGFTFTNFFTRSITMFPQNVGMAGGITGGATYVITSALSYGTTYLIRAENQLQLGYSYLLLLALAFVILIILPKKHTTAE